MLQPIKLHARMFYSIVIADYFEKSWQVLIILYASNICNNIFRFKSKYMQMSSNSPFLFFLVISKIRSPFEEV